MAEYIERGAIMRQFADRVRQSNNSDFAQTPTWNQAVQIVEDFPTADVAPVSEIEKIIESLQEQADIYNARAKELLVEEDGQVSQYTWAVSLRETYRRIIKILDDLIS